MQSNTYQSIHALYPISNNQYQIFLVSDNGTGLSAYSLNDDIIEYSSSSSLEIELNQTDLSNKLDRDTDAAKISGLDNGNIAWGSRNTYRLFYVGE